MTDDNSGIAEFTPTEIKLMVLLMKHQIGGEIQVSHTILIFHLDSSVANNSPQSDLEAVAIEMGYKNAKVVKDRWNQIKKKKLGSSTATGNDVERTTPSKKAAGTKRAGEDEGEVTPTPKKRGRKSKAETLIEEAAESKVKDEEDGEAMDTTEHKDELA